MGKEGVVRSGKLGNVGTARFAPARVKLFFKKKKKFKKKKFKKKKLKKKLKKKYYKKNYKKKIFIFLPYLQ